MSFSLYRHDIVEPFSLFHTTAVLHCESAGAFTLLAQTFERSEVEGPPPFLN